MIKFNQTDLLYQKSESLKNKELLVQPCIVNDLITSLINYDTFGKSQYINPMQKCYFKVPDAETRRISLGSLPGTPFRVRKSLQAIVPYFQPITMPQESDWLFDHEEEGQSFDAYKGQMHNQIDAKRRKIYILPLSNTIPQGFLQRLKTYSSAFYHTVPVQIMKPIDVTKMQNVTHRINEYTNKIQYNATHILRQLELKLPADAFCMIGVTLFDLYHKQEWNYVFGLGSMKNRTGVFSFARYQEQFFQQDKYETDYNKIYFRSVKVMVHEIGHMFGMRHCIYYNCIMNGSNHLEQSMRKHYELCPICLRKLQSNVGFDILGRYKMLLPLLTGDKGDKRLVEAYKLVETLIQKLEETFKNTK